MNYLIKDKTMTISNRVQAAADVFATLHTGLDINYVDYSVYHDSLHFFLACGVSLAEEQQVLVIEACLGNQKIPAHLEHLLDAFNDIPSELLEEYSNFYYAYFSN